MADPFTLERERADALLSLARDLLSPIMAAGNVQELAVAEHNAKEELLRLIGAGSIGRNQARPLHALVQMNAAERAREFPLPGQPAPVGLFGGQR
jgi:hypothetical protein